MFITGDVKVHKSDGVTRSAEAMKVDDGGQLAVYDDVPSDEFGFASISPSGDYQLVDKRTGEVIEPDIIVGPDMYDRIERKMHSWNHTSPKAIKQRAEREDGVDVEDIKDQL